MFQKLNMDQRSSYNFQQPQDLYDKCIQAASSETAIIQHLFMPSQVSVKIQGNDITIQPVMKSLINTCHMDTFLGCLYLTLSHYKKLNEFITEIEQNCGLELEKVFNYIKSENFSDAKFKWVSITNPDLLHSPNESIDLQGNNWERTGKALEFQDFLYRRNVCSEKSCPNNENTSTLSKLELSANLETITPNSFQLLIDKDFFINGRNTTKCQEVTHAGRCRGFRVQYHVQFKNGSPCVFIISLEKIPFKVNLSSLPMELTVGNFRYRFLFASLGTLTCIGIGHITGLMHLELYWLYYDGTKEYQLQHVNPSTQLAYDGIYLVTYLKISKVDGSVYNPETESVQDRISCKK